MSERRRERAGTLAIGGAALALAALVPVLVTDQAWLGVAVLVLVNSCATLGLTLLFGFAGQISLAQAAFFGIGAYAPGIAAVELGVSPWLGLPGGVLLAAAVAYVVGRPVLRLEGVYLAIATAALTIIFVVLVEQLEPITGGTFGLTGVEPLAAFGVDFIDPENLYYVVLAALLVLLLFAHRLVRSPLGKMFAAIGHDARGAGLAGIPVAPLKVKTFALSAAFAAVGGFFLTASLLVVTPGSFDIMPSVFFLVMVVVGGIRSLPGAILGSAFVSVVPQLLPDHPRAQEIVFAVAFMVVLMFLPDGLAGARTWSPLVRAVKRVSAR